MMLMKLRVGVFTFGAGALLSACTMQVSEGQFLRPVPGGSIDAQALAAAGSPYSLTPHTIATGDGAQLHAVHLRQPGAKKTILYFGGNGYTIGRFGGPTAGVFAPLGVDLMLVDHRGYGSSKGTPTAANIQADGIAAFDYLATLPGVNPMKIILHGQSLGSIIAGRVAAERHTGGVVLESSVTTMEDWVKARAGNAPVRVTVAAPLKGQGNLSKMPYIDEPLLLLVGANDAVTPPALSQALYHASPLPSGRKSLVVIDGAGHNDVLLRPAAIAAYRQFLSR